MTSKVNANRRETLSMKPWRLPPVAFPAVVLFVLGCGSGDLLNNDRVEGTVSLDGVKLPGVTLVFTPLTPVKGKVPIRSRAVTDEKGHFTLTRTDQRSGAAISKHRVTVSPAKSGAGAKVPAVYQLDGQTPLSIDVTAEQHDYELKLTRDAQPSGARDPGD
jgi:hypothetical protein